MATFVDLDSVWRDRDSCPNPCSYELSPGQIDTWTQSSRTVRPLPQNQNTRPLDFVSAITCIAATLPYPRIELFTENSVTVLSISGNVLTGSIPLTNNDILMISTGGYLQTYGFKREVEYHVINVAGNNFQLSLTQGGAAITTFTDGTGINATFAIIPLADYATIMVNYTSALQLLTFPRIYLDYHCKKYNDVRLLNTIKGVLPDAKFVLGIDKIQYDDNVTPLWIHYKSHGEQVMRYKRDDPVIVRFMTRDGTVIPFFTESDLNIPTNPMKQTLITLSVTPYIRDADYDNHMVNPIM